MTYFTGARTVHLIDNLDETFTVIIGNITVGTVERNLADEIKDGVYKVRRAYGDNPA